MAQEEELLNSYQSFLSRVELPGAAWHGVRGGVYKAERDWSWSFSYVALGEALISAVCRIGHTSITLSPTQ